MAQPMLWRSSDVRTSLIHAIAVPRIGVVAEHPELVADQRHAALLGPIRRLIDLRFDAGGVPVVLP